MVEERGKAIGKVPSKRNNKTEGKMGKYASDRKEECKRKSEWLEGNRREESYNLSAEEKYKKAKNDESIKCGKKKHARNNETDIDGEEARGKSLKGK